MAAVNITVVPVLPTSLRRDLGGVLANLVAAYRGAALRPRPPVRAIRTS
jgi:hypothetical protein